MKWILVLFAFYSGYVLSNDFECISKSESEALINSFSLAKDKYSFLKKIANKTVDVYFEKNALLKNSNSMIAAATEISYGWGESIGPGVPSSSSANFPDNKSCVWIVSLSLPEKIRRQCDDDGAYGYFLDFRKREGKIELYSFNDITEQLSDGKYACDKINGYLEHLITH